MSTWCKCSRCASCPGIVPSSAFSSSTRICMFLQSAKLSGMVPVSGVHQIAASDLNEFQKQHNREIAILKAYVRRALHGTHLMTCAGTTGITQQHTKNNKKQRTTAKTASNSCVYHLACAIKLPLIHRNSNHGGL